MRAQGPFMALQEYCNRIAWCEWCAHVVPGARAARLVVCVTVRWIRESGDGNLQSSIRRKARGHALSRHAAIRNEPLQRS